MIVKLIKDLKWNFQKPKVHFYSRSDCGSKCINCFRKTFCLLGEPGTGKTELARQIAKNLKLEIIEWNIKSTTKASQGLYEYDAVSRLRDSQIGDKKINNISNYIKKGKLWDAFESKKTVLLIDEIDKADIEFPNDLLQELDRMEFFVYEETGELIKAEERPIVIITSNNEKDLPEAFLRRCFSLYSIS